MADEKSIKKQRDQFLAFSFASADLFIEIDAEEKIIYALGAAKGIIGVSDQSLIGKTWLELFSPIDRPVLRALKAKAKPVLRCGPVLVTLNQDISDGKKAVVTAIVMPGNDHFFLTVGHSNMMMARTGEGIRASNETMIHNRQAFIDTATDALQIARTLGQDVDISVFEFGATQTDIQRFGSQGWSAFNDAVNELLLSKSADGNTAAMVANGKYTILHDKNVDPAVLQEQIRALALEQDLSGHGLRVETKTITSDLSEMSEREASRALLYTIHEFERKGTDITIETLNSGLKTYVSANAQRMKEFQNIIERTHFNLHFQPIVNLKTLEASHYEILCRFEQGDTLEWVMFGEDIGMAADFDIAVCERAINHVSFKAGGTKTRYSVNLSGQSIQDSEFREQLLNMLDKGSNLKSRLMFEITESSHITDLNMVNDFITMLKEKGYEIALDDFGAGSASFQYLQQLHVDYLKIDGKYIKKLLSSQRDLAMVKNLTQMAKDLGIKVIAEFVEDERQFLALRDLGVDFGQGYLFGKPMPHPDYIPIERLKRL